MRSCEFRLNLALLIEIHFTGMFNFMFMIRSTTYDQYEQLSMN